MANQIHSSYLPAIRTVGQSYGPFQVGTNYYVVLWDNANSKFAVLKASDPTSTWTAQDTANNPAHASATCGFAVLAGTTIHILSSDNNGSGSANIKYHTFNTSTDAWAVKAEAVQSNFNPKDTTPVRCSLAVLSNGNVVAFYQGTRQRVSGNYYTRVVYNIRSSGTWGGPVAVDSGGANDYAIRFCVLGKSDRVHFFYEDANVGSGDIVERSLSGSTLSTIHSCDGDNTNWMGAGIYDSTGDALWIPVWDAVVRTAVSSATSSWTGQTAGDTGHGWSYLSKDGLFMSCALDGSSIYVTWWSDSTGLIYYDHNAGAGFGTDVSTGISGSFPSTLIYTRGSGVYLGIVHTESGQTGTWYEEVLLRTLVTDRYGAADLTGTGTLSATAVSDHFMGAGLTGAGALSATGQVQGNWVGAASLSGSGTLEVSGTLVERMGIASLSGLGSLSATGIPERLGAAALSGTGTLSATGLVPIGTLGVRILSIGVEEDDAGNPIFHIEAMEDDLYAPA